MNSGSWIWPDVSTIDGAKDACRLAMWCATFVGGLTILFAILSVLGIRLFGTTPYAFVDAALLGAIAFGLYKYSRVAAVAGFALFLLEKVITFVQTGSILGVGAIGIVILIGFFNGIRGTFAYAKLSREAQHPSPVPFS